jgi:hypothetical protein
MQELRSSFFRGDPIGQLIVRRLRANTRLRVLLLAMGIGLFSFGLLPWLTGYLLPRPGVTSALEDWPGLVITFVTHPAIYLYFAVEQPDMILQLFLDYSLMCSAPEEIRFQHFMSELNRTLASRAWPVLALTLVSVGYALHVHSVLSQPASSYYNPHPSVFLLVTGPLSALVGYMVVMVAIRHVITIAAGFRLFWSRPPIISPRPGRWGGMAFVGRFALRAFCLVAFLGLDMCLLVAMNVQYGRNPLDQPDMQLFLLCYVLLSPLLVFLPLAPAIRSLTRARKGCAERGERRGN